LDFFTHSLGLLSSESLNLLKITLSNLKRA